MSPLNFTHILTQAVDELSESESYKGLFHQHKDGEPLPSARVLCEIIELSRSILFPGYFGNSTINSRTINYHIGVNIEKLLGLLSAQILAGLCFGKNVTLRFPKRQPPPTVFDSNRTSPITQSPRGLTTS